VTARPPLGRDLLEAIGAAIDEFWQRGDRSIRVEPGRDGLPKVIGVPRETVRVFDPRTGPRVA
jgi:hypothetical protein